MSRVSGDEIAQDGSILNGYDYSLQVWVLGGVIQNDGHPARLDHCKACAFAGVPVIAVQGHEQLAEDDIVRVHGKQMRRR